MRIGDELFFAPDIRFPNVDWDGNGLSDQYARRVQGFYLEPAGTLVKCRHAFAAGVILVSCVDTLAGLRYDRNNVTDRFKTWSETHLQSFNDPRASEDFCLNFRNGLVHEARIKKGGSFSLEQDTTVDWPNGVFSISPNYLLGEIAQAFALYTSRLKSDEDELQRLQRLRKRLKEDFQFELNN